MVLKVPDRVLKRFKNSLPKYRTILDRYYKENVNESDTVKVIRSILTDVFGYDKFSEVSSELLISGQFCDIAIKSNNKIVYLVECKRIKIKLNQNHLDQVLIYALNNKTEWVILTNGCQWQVYKINTSNNKGLEKLVFEIDILKERMKNKKFTKHLFLLSKESIGRKELDKYYTELNTINKHYISAIIQSDKSVNLIKSELKKLSKGLKVDTEMILDIINNDIICIDDFDDGDFKLATRRVKKLNIKKKLH